MSFKSVQELQAEYQQRLDDELVATRVREDDQAIFWWALDTEPGQTGQVGFIEEDSPLYENLERLGIYPFKTKAGRYLIFDAKYKVASGGEALTAEALSKPPPDMSGLPAGTSAPPMSQPEGVSGPIYLIMNFVAGFQIEAVEMMMAIGELSSLPDEDGNVKVVAQDGGGKKTPPKPPAWFIWPDEERVLLNKLYKRTKEASGYHMVVYIFAGRAVRLRRHWWLQMVLTGDGEVCEGDRKWPIPGEFIGLGVRMLRGLPWGEQKSSPFIYAGNWVDGVFLTTGTIEEIIEGGDYHFSTYKVKWHNLAEPITLKPSDFAEYKVGDRVTILKDVSITKDYQSSEDDDVQADCDKSKWQIVPITFYGDQGKQEE